MDDPVALYGTSEPAAPARRLAAGALSADLVDGNLRTIRFAGHEVLRAVAYVVRDRDWGTYAPVVTGLVVEETEARFAVRYRAECRAPDGATLRFAAEIVGESGGRLLFEVVAEPDGDFETNRTGFCVLHPIEGVAGRPVAVTHSDGSVENSTFPDLIEPWQPFRDIAAIRHEPAPGLAATCRMDGDVFEMEDQRAWSDASYKTYVRPLARPWPYVLPAGAPVRQRIVVEIAGMVDAPAAAAAAAAPIRLDLGAADGGKHPTFGVLVSPEDADAALAGADHLRRLAPRHLLLHFDPTAGHGEAELRALAGVRKVLPDAAAMLECVVPCERDLDAELGEAAAMVRAAGLRLDAVTVGPSVDWRSTPPGSEWPPCPPLEDVYAAARRAFPDVRLGGGMFSYFTELNRKRPPVGLLDYVTHATCPIVHAADDLSVMQSLEAIPFIARSARAIVGAGKPYHLGPVTIGMRQNPYGSRTVPNPDARRIAMADDDPRGRGLFAAAWLVGYAARLSGSAVAAWTGAAAAGPRGLLVSADGTPAPVPAYHVARKLAELSDLPRLPVRSEARSRVDGVATRTPQGTTVLLVANLTERAQPVILPAMSDGWRGGVLDARSVRGGFPDASPVAGGDLELPPYAVAWLEAAGAPTASAD